jgi:pilus assembly protein Flp/PilA
MIKGETMVNQIRKSLKSRKGASMVEYALLVSLIAVASIVVIKAVGAQLSAKFSSVSSALT